MPTFSWKLYFPLALFPVFLILISLPLSYSSLFSLSHTHFSPSESHRHHASRTLTSHPKSACIHLVEDGQEPRESYAKAQNTNNDLFTEPQPSIQDGFSYSHLCPCGCRGRERSVPCQLPRLRCAFLLSMSLSNL